MRDVDPLDRVLDDGAVKREVFGATSRFFQLILGVVDGFRKLETEDPNQHEWLMEAVRVQSAETGPVPGMGTPEPESQFRIGAMHLAHSMRDQYDPILRTQILDRLPRPRVCTLDDLSHAFRTQMLTRIHLHREPSIDSILDAAYGRFKAAVFDLVDGVRWSEPFAVARGLYDLGSNEYTLWRGHSEFRISLVGALRDGSTDRVDATHPNLWPQIVYACISGYCSREAIHQAETEIQAALRSVFTTLSSLSWQPFFDTSQEEHTVPDPWIMLVADGKLHPDFALIPDCLRAYFSHPMKKDSIDRRIRNAIYLLVEADRQEHHAIGLSLAVAAMEALVGRKGEEISNLIADNVAVMLEPDPNRRADAVELAKNIYDCRSSVLHGSTVEGEHEKREQARLLASGMLKAMLERRATVRRLGFDPETPTDLLKEMKRAKFTPGLPAGVTESLVRRLWGAPYSAGDQDSGN